MYDSGTRKYKTEAPIQFRGVQIRSFWTAMGRAIPIADLYPLSEPLHPGLAGRLSQYTVRLVPPAERDQAVPKLHVSKGGTLRTITAKGLPYHQEAHRRRFGEVDAWAMDPELLRFLEGPPAIPETADEEPAPSEPDPIDDAPIDDSPTALLRVAQIGQEFRVDSRLIARELSVQHKSVLALLDTYLSDFEEFGTLAFEMRPLPNGGLPVRFTHLNDNQAALLLTYSQNTPEARSLKKKLIRTFEHYRNLALPKLTGTEYLYNQIIGAHEGLKRVDQRVDISSTEAKKAIEEVMRRAERSLRDLDELQRKAFHKEIRNLCIVLTERIIDIETDLASERAKHAATSAEYENTNRAVTQQLGLLAARMSIVEDNLKKSVQIKARQFVGSDKWLTKKMPASIRSALVGYTRDEALQFFNLHIPSENYTLGVACSERQKVDEHRKTIFELREKRPLLPTSAKSEGEESNDQNASDPDQRLSWDYVHTVGNMSLFELGGPRYLDPVPFRKEFERPNESIITCWVHAGLIRHLNRALEAHIRQLRNPDSVVHPLFPGGAFNPNPDLKVVPPPAPSPSSP